jgi:3-dehydroquinate dehydratase-1
MPPIFHIALLDPQTLAAAECAPDAPEAHSIRKCNAVELRYDLFPDRSEWPTLAARASALNPEATRLATIRLQIDGGAFPTESAHERFDLWHSILHAPIGVHWVDLERGRLADFHESPFVKPSKLLSEHHFDGIPSRNELDDFAQYCQENNAQGCKVAAMSLREGDDTSLYDFAEEWGGHFQWFAAFAMGQTGQRSRVESLWHGANLCYLSVGQALAPGQLSVADWFSKFQEL